MLLNDIFDSSENELKLKKRHLIIIHLFSKCAYVYNKNHV